MHSWEILHPWRDRRNLRFGSAALSNRLVLALALSVAMLSAPLIVRFANPSNSSLKTIPFLMALLVLILGLARERAVRRVSLLSPLVFAAAAYFTMFIAVPLADLWFHNPVTFQRSWWSASWFVVYGAFAILVGHTLPFHLVRHHSVDRITVAWRLGITRWVAVTLLMIGGFAAIQSIGGFSALPSYISSFATRYNFVSNTTFTLVAISLAAPAICLLSGSWLMKSTRRRLVLILLVWLPPALLISAYLGQRWRALSILVALSAIVHFGYRRIPASLLAVLSLGLVVLFLTVGLQRNIVGTQTNQIDVTGRNFYYNYVGVGHELSQFREFIITLDGVPSRLEFQGGATFLSVLPSTPFPTSGYLYTSTFFPELYENGVSVPTPLPGELHMNFGTWGILIGMILYGALLGSLEMFFQRNRNTVGGVLIYSYSLLPVSLILRGDFTTFGGWYLVGLVALFLALRFVEVRSSASKADTYQPQVN